MSLRYAILTLLYHQKLSGYQLLDYFDGTVGFVWHATHTQIYRELAAMADCSLVTPRVVRQSSRPDKKVYAITARGRSSLLEWVAEPAFERQLKDEALLRAFSYGLIDRDVAIARLDELRAQHEQRLARYRQVEEALRAAPDHPFRTGSLLTLAAAEAFESTYVEWCARAPRILVETSAAAGKSSKATATLRKARTARSRERSRSKSRTHATSTGNDVARS